MTVQHIVVGGHPWDHLGILYRRHRLTHALTQDPNNTVYWACQNRWGLRKRPDGWWRRELRSLLARPKRQGKLQTVYTKGELITRAFRRIPGPLRSRLITRSFPKPTGKRVIWYTVPLLDELLELPADRVVYDCSDMWSARHPELSAAEDRIIANADLCFASSLTLRDRLRQKRDDRSDHRVHLVENGVDSNAFEDGPPHPQIAAIPGPKLGFVGGLKPGKVDLELIANVAQARPDWNIILVGPLEGSSPAYQRFEQAKNVHLIGPVPPEVVPSVHKAVDVAILAYAECDYTKGIFPLKLWEALATGIGAVGCGIPATKERVRARHYSHVAAKTKPFVKAVEAMLACDGEEVRKARIASARDHTWDPKLQQMIQTVMGDLRR